MKTLYFVVLLMFLSSLMIYSCTKTEARHTSLQNQNIFSTISANGFDPQGRFVGTASFISTLEANRMINSYLDSPNLLKDKSSIHAWTVNGMALSMILSNPSVKSIKFMLGHKIDYKLSVQKAAAPSSGINAVITLIAVGLDSAGNYVTEDGNVLDNSMPCPEICPPGSGGNSTITNP